MTSPAIINLNKNCANVLKRTLLTTIPDEGCALLIGTIEPLDTCSNAVSWQVHLIWPCCNIWEPGIDNSPKVKEGIKTQEIERNPTKKNRFAIDPREQLHAQRWARYRKMQVLGTAHSHPRGKAIPSLIDLSYVKRDQLMLIMDRFGEIRCWWLTNNQRCKPIKLVISKSRNTAENNVD
tara:strand:- start:22650 stop:23186 length:537 start_codon:yes stop_codon:yes gene_type:complete